MPTACRPPHFFDLLQEDNARKGFLEEEQLAEILPKLPAYGQLAVRVAYRTGWRIQSELLTREWRHVNLKAGRLRLEPGETKNGEGRMFPLPSDLKEALEAQRAATTSLEQATGQIIPLVFHNEGRRIDYRRFLDAWSEACRGVGFPGKLLHDLRRSAARNMLRAGISERVIMELCGWKTGSMFKRYAAVDERMLEEAGAKLERATVNKP